MVQSSDHEQSLQMLQSLLQAGVVSQPEFEAKKAKLTSLAGISDSRIHNMKYDSYSSVSGRGWETVEEALQELKTSIWIGSHRVRWKFAYRQQLRSGESTLLLPVYSCLSHVGCTVKAKVTLGSSGFLVQVLDGAVHNIACPRQLTRKNSRMSADQEVSYV